MAKRRLPKGYVDRIEIPNWKGGATLILRGRFKIVEAPAMESGHAILDFTMPVNAAVLKRKKRSTPDKSRP